MNKLAIKVYKIDYDFIIKNYLDRELWKKTWTLFEYRGFVFTLELDSINVKSNTIHFVLRGNYTGEEYTGGYWTYVSHNIENSKISILQNQINGSIISLAKDIERAASKKTDGYYEICDAYDNEEEVLRNIANDFLDREGISNSEIRNAYVDYYVNENSKLYYMQDSYINSMQYKIFPELYLTLSQITNRDGLRLDVENSIGSTKTDEIMKELQEFLEEFESDDYIEEMEGNLDEI